MMPTLLQSEALPDFYRAMEKQFHPEDTGSSMLLALGVVAVLIVVVYAATRFERRPKVPVGLDHPGRVLKDALQKLGFTPAQQRTLESFARDSKVPHPAALLLSERLFDQHVTAWQSKRGAASPDPEAETLRKARTRLFPTGVGWVSSGPPRV